jgi:hypothetical protein
VIQTEHLLTHAQDASILVEVSDSHCWPVAMYAVQFSSRHGQGTIPQPTCHLSKVRSALLPAANSSASRSRPCLTARLEGNSNGSSNSSSDL